MPDILFALSETTLPAWGATVIQAFTTVCNNITEMIAQTAPVALPVGGAYLAIRYGWRTAKGLTK